MTCRSILPFLGYVTHATDRPLWCLRVPILTPDQLETARKWLTTIDSETAAIEAAGRPLRDVHAVLTLHEDRAIAWAEDRKYDEVMRLAKVLPGE